MNKLFIISTFACYLLVAVQGDCSIDKDKGNGTSCGSAPSMRFYFNQKKFRCMTFTYLGCGGNDNNFETLDACQTKCKPVDSQACFGASYSPPSPMPAGALNLGLYWCRIVGCPTGYQCQTGGLISQCCNSATENWFMEAYDPKCKSGKTALQLGDHVVAADSCSDLSCPQGQTCEMTNQLFAKCCK